MAARTTTIQVLLPAWWRDEIRRRATLEGVTMTKYVIDRLERRLDLEERGIFRELRWPKRPARTVRSRST